MKRKHAHATLRTGVLVLLASVGCTLPVAQGPRVYTAADADYAAAQLAAQGASPPPTFQHSAADDAAFAAEVQGATPECRAHLATMMHLGANARFSDEYDLCNFWRASTAALNRARMACGTYPRTMGRLAESQAWSDWAAEWMRQHRLWCAPLRSGW